VPISKKMGKTSSISIIVPALNEEKHLRNTVGVIAGAAKKRFIDYEIIIIDDGSTDETRNIAERLSKEDSHIKCLHNRRPACIGGVYKQGLKVASKEYIIRVNGKNDITVENLDKIFAYAGMADIVIPYQENFKERPLFRKAASLLFTFFLNFLCGLRLRYYNHYVLCRKALINSLLIRTDSYAFQAEVLIRLIKSGYSYIEVGVNDKFEDDIKSKAFSLQNICGVALFFIQLPFYIKNRK